jgi:arginine repressor
MKIMMSIENETISRDLTEFGVVRVEDNDDHRNKQPL